MARVLLAWELGIGLGHLVNLRPLATELAKRGHEVFFAGRDLSQATRAFDSANITLLPAPWKCRSTATVEQVVTFADLLFNIGFGDPESLTAHVSAWRNLYRLVNPDLLVCDHSPTALLAAIGQRFAVATVGNGFLCPIDENPLRLLRAVSPEAASAARDREEQVLGIVNSVLRAHSSFTLDRVTQIYHRTGIRHFLTTFQELDHFPGRTDGDYRGAWPYGLDGERFAAPGDGRCLFGYLKPFPTIKEFLTLLANSHLPAVVYIAGWSEAEKAPFQSHALRLSQGPVDIRQAAAGCSAAITHAGFGTCVAMLLAGKPLVHVPTQLEQLLFCRVLNQLGFGFSASENDARGIIAAVEHVLSNSRYTAAAADFAKGHEVNPNMCAGIADDLEKLLHDREIAVA